MIQVCQACGGLYNDDQNESETIAGAMCSCQTPTPAAKSQVFGQDQFAQQQCPTPADMFRARTEDLGDNPQAT